MLLDSANEEIGTRRVSNPGRANDSHRKALQRIAVERLTHVEVQNITEFIAFQLPVTPARARDFATPIAVIHPAEPPPLARALVRAGIGPRVPPVPPQREVHDRERVALLVQEELRLAAILDGGDGAALLDYPVARPALGRLRIRLGLDCAHALAHPVYLLEQAVRAGAGIGAVGERRRGGDGGRVRWPRGRVR